MSKERKQPPIKLDTSKALAQAIKETRATLGVLKCPDRDSSLAKAAENFRFIRSAVVPVLSEFEQILLKQPKGLSMQTILGDPDFTLHRDPDTHCFEFRIQVVNKTIMRTLCLIRDGRSREGSVGNTKGKTTTAKNIYIRTEKDFEKLWDTKPVEAFGQDNVPQQMRQAIIRFGNLSKEDIVDKFKLAISKVTMSKKR